MISGVRVFPWTSRVIDDLARDEYHGILATLGYELRSRSVPVRLHKAAVKVAPGFDSHHVGSYKANLEALVSAGFDVDSVSDEDFPSTVRRFFAAATKAAAEKLPRVAVDISSMSRWRIAVIVEELMNPEIGAALVDILYAPAAFGEPSTEEIPILNVEPVSPFLAGWWEDLDQPLSAVIGLGYELEHASSAIDRLEPEATYLFVPHGEEPRYLERIEEANRGLLQEAKDAGDTIAYRVAEPYALFQSLDTVLRRLRTDQRVAVVALGPKIFAACAGLACSFHHPAAQLIRVSAKERQIPVERSADGTLCGLRLAVGSVDDSAIYMADQLSAKPAAPEAPDTELGGAVE